MESLQGFFLFGPLPCTANRFFLCGKYLLELQPATTAIQHLIQWWIVPALLKRLIHCTHIGPRRGKQDNVPWPKVLLERSKILNDKISSRGFKEKASNSLAQVKRLGPRNALHWGVILSYCGGPTQAKQLNKFKNRLRKLILPRSANQG